MIPTIRIFTQALLTPDLSFETLGDARAVLGADGLPVLRRTTRFVEAEIEWRGTRHLLSLPLNRRQCSASNARRQLSAKSTVRR